jgi:hypothetical protein
MFSVLPAPIAKLQELQALFSVLLVLCRRIIFPFALGANQGSNFSHKKNIPEAKKIPPQKLSQIFGNIKEFFSAPRLRRTKSHFTTISGILSRGILLNLKRLAGQAGEC